MDPWLEHPGLWPDVHQSLITYAREDLQPQVGDRYVVGIGERVFVERAAGAGPYPDLSVAGRQQEPPGEVREDPGVAAPIVIELAEVERREPFLEILRPASDGTVVTVIEILSPSNKRPGRGREAYLAKQAEVLRTDGNLLEIDLLRAGEATVALPAELCPPSAYRAVLSPATNRQRREVFPIALRESLPRLPVPLGEGERPIVLDLQAVLERVYDVGTFARRIDYRAPPPPPPLEAADEAWLSGRLA
jgi:hypothetical protein